MYSVTGGIAPNRIRLVSSRTIFHTRATVFVDREHHTKKYFLLQKKKKKSYLKDVHVENNYKTSQRGIEAMWFDSPGGFRIEALLGRGGGLSG